MKTRRLVVPVALAVTSCSPQPAKCMDSPGGTQLCWPDGGMICPFDSCAPAREADGGFVYDSAGKVQCLC